MDDQYVELNTKGESSGHGFGASGIIFSERSWKIFFGFLMVAKFMAFFAPVADLSGGIPEWCDCENRTFETPFQKHLQGFGWWYHILIWIHFLFAIFIIPPALVAIFSVKGSQVHIYSGRIYLFCWIVQMVVGIISGGVAQIGRGPHPGQDPNHKSTDHYWGTFPFYVFVLFSFILSCACEQLANGTAALQFRKGDPPRLIHHALVFGSFMTILNGVTMFTVATFTLANHPEPGTSGAFYPWLYYIVIPLECFMASLNLRYWLSDTISRETDWVKQHIRAMSWSAFITFFFILENVAYKISRTQDITLWILVPTWVLDVLVFGSYIWYYTRKATYKSE